MNPSIDQCLPARPTSAINPWRGKQVHSIDSGHGTPDSAKMPAKMGETHLDTAEP
jgi:hypothetical protein